MESESISRALIVCRGARYIIVMKLSEDCSRSTVICIWRALLTLYDDLFLSKQNMNTVPRSSINSGNLVCFSVSGRNSCILVVFDLHCLDINPILVWSDRVFIWKHNRKWKSLKTLFPKNISTPEFNRTECFVLLVILIAVCFSCQLSWRLVYWLSFIIVTQYPPFPFLD